MQFCHIILSVLYEFQRKAIRLCVPLRLGDRNILRGSKEIMLEGICAEVVALPAELHDALFVNDKGFFGYGAGFFLIDNASPFALVLCAEIGFLPSRRFFRKKLWQEMLQDE